MTAEQTFCKYTGDDQGHSQALPAEVCDLPDRWCFGLAHPYIQRLIFMAGDFEQRNGAAASTK
jgi:hypothetical protein